MAEFSEIQHPIPKGEIPFQTLCLKLVRRYWKDDLAELHGRKGQGQDGADITGRDNRNGYKIAGFQCKGSDTNEPRALSIGELENEVKKAKGFTPPLDIFYVAYAGKRDAEIQKRAKALSAENEKAGLFRIEVWSWDDIISRAENFPDIAAELLVRIGAPTTTTALSPKRPTNDKFAALEKMQNAVAEIQAAITDDTPTAEADDPIAQGKIDVFRDQILVGDGKAVVKGLRGIISDLRADAPARVRFRAYANLGAALTQAGEFDQAAVAFDEAAAAEPETADGKAYAARSAFMRRQNAQAYSLAEEALRLDSKQKLAATILIDTASNQLKSADLEKNVLNVLTEPDVGWALSRRYSTEGAHDEALRVARIIEQKDENWTRDLAIGEAIISRFEEDYAARMGAPQTSQSKALLHEAVERLDRAWKKVGDRTDKKNWAYVGANVSAAHRLIGDDETADALALKAFSFAPESLALKERAALAYARQKEYDKAVSLASEVAEAGDSEEAIFAASIATAPKQWDVVRKYAQKAFDTAKDDFTKARASELLVLAEYREKDAAAALSLADTLRPQFASSVTFEARAAEMARRLGETAAIEAAQQRIDAFDLNKLNPVERFELSDAYSDSGNWSGAADLLDGLHTNDRPSELLNRHLYALYRANRRSDARQLYEALSVPALASKEVQRLGAAIYERSGMLPQALQCLDAALKIDVNDLRSHLDWARLQLRSGGEKPVSRWIKKVKLDLDGDAEDRMEFAQLLARYGRDKDALAVGYDVVRKNWGKDERVHLAYHGLFLLRGAKNDNDLHPTQVAENTVVFLRDEHGSNVEYRIETGELAAGVLPPDHPFAKELCGAKVGQSRQSQPGLGEPKTWTVTAIKHKYVDLFHRAMDQHSTLFPGSRALGSFHIDPEAENGFEPIFEQVRARGKHAEAVAKLYDEQLIPIDLAGKMLGVDGIDASLGLRGRMGRRLDNCVGLLDERMAAIDHVRNAQRVTVDYITLAIWNDIGLLSEVETQNSLQIDVVQSTVDVLAMRAEMAAQSVKQKGGSLEAHGDKIALYEPTQAERKQNAEKWGNLEKWVRDHATIVPTESISGISEDKIATVLSPAVIDTIAISAKSKSILVSEDRRLRVLAASLGATASSWTQPLLMTMLEEGKITREKYVELLAKLQRQQVGFVSVGAADLLTALETGNEDHFIALAEALTGASVHPGNVVSIAAAVITQIWYSPNHVLNRERATSQIFDALLSQRKDSMKIFRLSVRLVTNKIDRFPIGLRMLRFPWSKYIEGFLQGHFLMDVYLK